MVAQIQHVAADALPISMFTLEASLGNPDPLISTRLPGIESGMRVSGATAGVSAAATQTEKGNHAINDKNDANRTREMLRRASMRLLP